MTIYSGKKISLELLDQKYEIIRNKPAVAILPVNFQGQFIFVKQHRYPLNKKIIEIPAGLLNHGEDPQAGAQRELREETGFKAQKITYWGSFYTSPGYSDEKVNLFLGENLQKSPLPPDDGEDIKLLFVNKKEALAMIESEQIQDAKTVIAILRYYLKSCL